MRCLLDLAACSHMDLSSCTCPPSKAVPESWRSFIEDQRGPRLQNCLLNRLHLRAASVPTFQLSPEETRAREKEKKKNDREKKEAEFEKKAKDNLVKQKELLKRKIKMESSEDSDSEVNSESEWEDEEETMKTGEYNTLQLKNFAREVDRYKVSNRAAAKIGNGLLKDLKIVTKNKTTNLLCPGKVRRERCKWGGRLEKIHQAKQPPAGLYCDGKKCPTLTRETNCVPVQVRGARGRGAKKMVATTSTQKVVTEHFTCVSEPGGEYLTHVTPTTGHGRAIAQELVAVIRERGINLTVMGMDGTAVNTGVHNGVIRIVEQELEEVVQHIICLLHLNELPFRHEFCEVDGVTSGPDAFKGKIGKDVAKDVWKDPIVNFPTVKGKMPILSEEQLKDTSRDQCLVYHLGHALQSGVVPDKIAGATIGPMLHARWLTLVARILRKGLSTKKPSKALSRLLFMILNFYLPVWFRIKNNPHCQSGALHFYYMLELSRELGIKSQEVTHKVLQGNSYWAHPENIIIACLADTDKKIRTKGVNYILAARENFNPESHPRQFFPPDINLKAQSYVELIDWDKAQKTEPPLTKQMSKEDILSVLEAPLKLPSYPCHTQDVERLIPVVTESCLQKVGYSARHGWILSTMESRKLVPKFDSKKQDI